MKCNKLYEKLELIKLPYMFRSHGIIFRDLYDKKDPLCALKLYTYKMLWYILITLQSGCVVKLFLHKEYYLLGYNAVYSVENQPTFRSNIPPASSGSKNKPS
jgi:hypothetical protein